MMYILNENGYPNMHIDEARTTITFITQLLYDPYHYSCEEREGGGGLQVRGHFYVNDIKVSEFVHVMYVGVYSLHLSVYMMNGYKYIDIISVCNSDLTVG
ncbi:hypothetical protein EON65_10890 [archaeon]|nr:MAG: hypothetical protein EON65_10890 [archaeon]